MLQQFLSKYEIKDRRFPRRIEIILFLKLAILTFGPRKKPYKDIQPAFLVFLSKHVEVRNSIKHNNNFFEHKICAENFYM